VRGLSGFVTTAGQFVAIEIKAFALIDPALSHFHNCRSRQGSMSTRRPLNSTSPNPAGIRPHHFLTSLATESLGELGHI
jgi:hypothetical protein